MGDLIATIRLEEPRKGRDPWLTFVSVYTYVGGPVKCFNYLCAKKMEGASGFEFVDTTNRSRPKHVFRICACQDHLGELQTKILAIAEKYGLKNGPVIVHRSSSLDFVRRIMDEAEIKETTRHYQERRQFLKLVRRQEKKQEKQTKTMRDMEVENTSILSEIHLAFERLLILAPNPAQTYIPALETLAKSEEGDSLITLANWVGLKIVLAGLHLDLILRREPIQNDIMKLTGETVSTLGSTIANLSKQGLKPVPITDREASNHARDIVFAVVATLENFKKTVEEGNPNIAYLQFAYNLIRRLRGTSGVCQSRKMHNSPD